MSPSRSLECARNVLLALHGPPFSEVSITSTPDRFGNSLGGFGALVAETSPRNMAIADEALLGIRTSIATITERKPQIITSLACTQIIDAALKVLETANLDPQSWRAVTRKILGGVFSDLVNEISGLPRLEESSTRISDGEYFSRVEWGIERATFNWSIIARFPGNDLEKTKAPFLKDLALDVMHDCSGLLTKMRSFTEALRAGHTISSWRAFGVVRFGMEVMFRAHYGLAIAKADQTQCDLAPSLAHAARLLAQQFGFTVVHTDYPPVITSASVNELSDKVVIPNTVGPAWIDPSMISLLVYNLVKNSFKVAAARQCIKPGMVVSATNVDENFCAVFIRDTGVGIDDREVANSIKETAWMRRSQLEMLSPLEECLLDEQWARHVPPVALFRALLDRGRSIGHGTGIGLHLATRIAEMNGGSFQIYNHPVIGASCMLLLPRRPGTTSSDLTEAHVRMLGPDRLMPLLQA